MFLYLQYMSCLEKVVTLGVCPDSDKSLSGLYLIKAAGMSPQILDNIANEVYISGANMAMEKKPEAILKVKNDFIASLQINGAATQVAKPVFNAADFNTPLSKGAGNNRGLTFHKLRYKGTLRRSVVNAIQCFPLTSGVGKLRMTLEKSGYVQAYVWDVEYVANQINVFDKDVLSEFPFVIPPEAKSVLFTTDPNIQFCSSVITCLKGCNGSMPNDCGWVDGWDGTKAVKDEGFGVNIEFLCECNYEQILCNLADTFTGELISLQWQMLIMEEQLKSDRFSNWVTYNRDEIKEYVLPDLQSKYATKWNGLMSGMIGLLKKYRDECIECKGIRWRTNG